MYRVITEKIKREKVHLVGPYYANSVCCIKEVVQAKVGEKVVLQEK